MVTQKPAICTYHQTISNILLIYEENWVLFFCHWMHKLEGYKSDATLQNVIDRHTLH